MAVLVDNNERKLVPAWKPFAYSMPEVQPIKETVREVGDISEFVAEWRNNRNIGYAGDLITAAIVQNREDAPEVVEAARFILDSKDNLPDPLVTKAKQLSDDLGFALENPDTSFISVCKQVANFKLFLTRYPKDAILHVEIARCYLMLGVVEKAELHILYALNIDSNNRYVVRCATRFYIHLRQWDEALRVIHRSSLTIHDPWLLATEISISQINKKTSRNIKRGQNFISSGNYSPFNLTELRAAIATEEFTSGAFSKSRKLFNESLSCPNSNSLAQARWIAAHNGINLDFDKVNLSTGRFVEAKSYKAFESGNYSEALSFAKDWIAMEPYSTRTILYAYNISANYLDDYTQGEDILSEAIKTHKTNPVLLNDYAYTLALNGKQDEASKVINKARAEDSENPLITGICITATKGMIAFRHNNVELGNKLYMQAIEKSAEITSNPNINYSAILNYCREVLLCDNSDENKDAVKSILSRLPDNTNNVELSKLKKKVEELVKE